MIVSSLLAIAILKQREALFKLSWVHFGAQAYAFLLTLGIAVQDPTAYWGMALMFFSAALAFGVALRLTVPTSLWGPFRFFTASDTESRSLWLQTLKQIASMWTVFLVLIPTAIAMIEAYSGWNSFHFQFEYQVAIGLAMALGFGSIGIWAGRLMVVSGEGTPLPAQCTRKLVVAGPYKILRNPMAACGISQGICVGIVFGSPLIVIYSVIGGFFWELLARGEEEQYLESQFGEDFVSYRESVRCWLPFRKGE